MSDQSLSRDRRTEYVKEFCGMLGAEYSASMDLGPIIKRVMGQAGITIDDVHEKLGNRGGSVLKKLFKEDYRVASTYVDDKGRGRGTSPHRKVNADMIQECMGAIVAIVKEKGLLDEINVHEDKAAVKYVAGEEQALREAFAQGLGKDIGDKPLKTAITDEARAGRVAERSVVSFINHEFDTKIQDMQELFRENRPTKLTPDMARRMGEVVADAQRDTSPRHNARGAVHFMTENLMLKGVRGLSPAPIIAHVVQRKGVAVDHLAELVAGHPSASVMQKNVSYDRRMIKEALEGKGISPVAQGIFSEKDLKVWTDAIGMAEPSLALPQRADGVKAQPAQAAGDAPAADLRPADSFQSRVVVSPSYSTQGMVSQVNVAAGQADPLATYVDMVQARAEAPKGKATDGRS